MKKFVFALQSLYDLRKTEEDAKKKELHEIEQRLSALHLELMRLKTERKNSHQEYTQQLADGAVNADKLNQYTRYFKSLEDQMAVQRARIAAQNKKKDECVAELIELGKEIKSLENLREKRYEEYLVEVRKDEEKEIDNIVSFKTASK